MGVALNPNAFGAIVQRRPYVLWTLDMGLAVFPHDLWDWLEFHPHRAET